MKATADSTAAFPADVVATLGREDARKIVWDAILYLLSIDEDAAASWLAWHDVVFLGNGSYSVRARNGIDLPAQSIYIDGACLPTHPAYFGGAR